MAFLDFNLRLTWQNLLKWLFLKLLSSIYGSLVTGWLFLYRSGIKSSYTTEKPLISVGNITLGGTGKTPMIDWLLSYCEKKQLTAAVLTRGYKSEGKSDFLILNQITAHQGNGRQFGDEPWLLYQKHPQTTFYIGPDRVSSSKKAEPGCDLLLLDDGMQHLRIGRMMNMVLIDSLSGFGNGKLFPLGPLREPLNSLARADIIVYTRTNLASHLELKKTVEQYLKPGTPQFQTRFMAEEMISSHDHTPVPASMLAGKKCLLFSGIGNPESFSQTVSHLGADVDDHLIFADHNTYNSTDLEKIRGYLKNRNYDYLICTEKDWVKLEAYKHVLPEFWYLKMILSVDQEFQDFIENSIKQER